MSLNKVQTFGQNFSTKAEKIRIFSGQLNPVIEQVNTNETNISTNATSVALKANTASPTFTGTVTLPDVVMSGHTNSQVFLVNTFNCPTPASEWFPSQFGAYCPASQTAVQLYIPLSFLKAGDEIISYRLFGDLTVAASVTLDCKMQYLETGNPPSATDITGGAITQVTADGAFTSTKTLTAVETVTAARHYSLLVVATTGAGDSIYVTGAEITVNRK